MTSYFLWLVVVTLIQLSLLTLWFDSEILSPLLQYCLKQKAKNPKGIKWFVFSVLTCPMCLGYWLAWGSAILLSFFPFSPTTGIGIYKAIALIFVTGLAVAVLSRLIDGFMPEPVNQKLLIVETEEETPSEESNPEGKDNNGN